jgi:hypothetical protein
MPSNQPLGNSSPGGGGEPPRSRQPAIGTRPQTRTGEEVSVLKD